MVSETEQGEARSRNFIEEIIDADLAEGRHQGIVTRFPPEPNGYLHIGHAMSICLNFGLAQAYSGRFHLRFDDTNPAKEETEYVQSIKTDVSWLGADWGRHLYFASDYFEQLYAWACELIRAGKAYVDDASAEQISRGRGTLTQPGVPSPCRERSIEENLRLFEEMRAGQYPDGAKVLRAKIDMASPNLNLRDPVLYRIAHVPHHRTGSQWCIYPMYDFAHGQSDAIEGITHSICTLEFEDHRPLYNWFLDHLPVPHRPRQIEFARLNLTHTVTSKRKLLQLVKEGHVRGWDDPRMPTISGIRRRGYTPEAIREFVRRVGVAKRNKTIDLALLEFCLRQDLEEKAPRRMAVLDPLKVIITNLPAGSREVFSGPNHPAHAEMGSRDVVLTREIFIEQTDFMEHPPKKYFRLAPGAEVRLRYACYITCTEVIRDPNGKVIALHAEMDPQSRGGSTPDGRKVKGTLHWVSATENTPLEARLYGNLFSAQDPDDVPEGKSFLDLLAEDSLEVRQAFGEPALRASSPGDRFQFERLGYFCVDPDSTPARPVVNRTAGLRDSWAGQTQNASA